MHWWDYATSIPELMQSLNSLVVAGKVLYLGISDAPAWVVRYVCTELLAFRIHILQLGLLTFQIQQGE